MMNLKIFKLLPKNLNSIVYHKVAQSLSTKSHNVKKRKYATLCNFVKYLVLLCETVYSF